MSSEQAHEETSDIPAEEPSPGGSTMDWLSGRTGTVAVVVALALLAFGLGRWTGGGGGGGDGAAGASASEESAESQQYTCPMHPDVRSDDPDDTCPICGMDLVPVGEASGGSEGPDIPHLELSDRALEVAKVRTVEAKRQSVAREIRTYGRVEPAEEAETDLTSWVRGRIEHLDIEAKGQRIARGQRIGRLYSPKLESVQKEFLQAIRNANETGDSAGSSARKRAAGSAVEAARRRLRTLGLQPSQIDAIAKEGEAREVVNLYADTGGTVRKRHVFEGEWVDTGERIASLQGLDTVWVQLEVYESDLPFIEEGTPVTLEMPNRPGFEREGRIEFIDPVVDPKNGTARARVVASNADGNLPPGSDIRATIEASIEGDPPPVSVPESAVLWTGPRSVVYRYDRSMEQPAFVPQEVELGPKVGERRVIQRGLSEGDEVAANGAFQLDAELQVQGEPSMMTGLHPSQQLEPEPVEVPEDGKEFDPPVQQEQIPEGAWYCPMGDVHWAQPDEGEGECPVCGMNLEKQGASEKVEVPEEGEEFDPPVSQEQLPEDVWYCPMDDVHWAQPEEGDGECPVCGMNLEKHNGGEGADEGSHDHDEMQHDPGASQGGGQ